MRFHTCPLELPNHGVSLCALHKRMDDVLSCMEEALRSTTLAELLSNPNPGILLRNDPESGETDSAPCAKG